MQYCATYLEPGTYCTRIKINECARAHARAHDRQAVE